MKYTLILSSILIIPASCKHNQDGKNNIKDTNQHSNTSDSTQHTTPEDNYGNRSDNTTETEKKYFQHNS